MSDFRVINDRELGYCFRFNSIPINGSFLASSRVGKTYGLSVELFAGLPIETFVIKTLKISSLIAI